MTLDGEFVFKLKATHGLPLDFIVDRTERDGVRINWPQTHDEIWHSLIDHKQERDVAINQLKHFVLAKGT